MNHLRNPSRLGALLLCFSLTVATVGCGATDDDTAKEGDGSSVTTDAGQRNEPGDSDGGNEAAADDTEEPAGEQPTASLPDGFPAEIPLPDLPIASAIALTTTEGWIVNFRADDLEGEMEKAHTALNEAGFEDSYWGVETGDGLVKNADFKVNVLLTESNSWISFKVVPA